MGPAQKAWNQAVQARVASANHLLKQIKGVKMTGLTSVAADHVQGLRLEEVSKSKDMRKVIILTFGLCRST
jgi:hypothetical protein